MTGLIPLVLRPSAPPGNRASVSAPPRPAPPPKHTRHASTSSVPLSPFQQCFPKSRAAKHTSQPILPSLPVLPYTPAEWRRTMAEIKRQHVARRFRACSARCIEILENIRDTSKVEPVHLIYLQFYAANSLEMCARPFSSAVPARTQLLSQARKHYDQAAALIQNAEHSVVCKARSPALSATFQCGSLHSPSGSVSSGTWSTPTTATSPTNSICSFDDFEAKHGAQSPATTPRKPKKTVSFSLPKEETLNFLEPYIRPDSPTLGFEDAYFVAPITRQELPKLPPKQPEMPVATPNEKAHHDERCTCETRRSGSSLSRHSILSDDLGSFQIERSVHRYCETLSSLQTQLAAHRSSVDALLEEPERLKNGGEGVGSSKRLSNAVAMAPASEELRSLDRRARIERLRQTGWQRKRFDASRYEQLCNNAMAELS